MNTFELKNELDELYAQLNPPYGVHHSGTSWVQQKMRLKA